METRTVKFAVAFGKSAAKLALGCVIAVALASCGSQQFDSIPTTESNAAPGALQIQPKVDVVLVEDDTGRIQDNYSQISADAQGFLTSLDSQGWNYHFATLRLTTPEAVSEAVSSKQDPNWSNATGGSQWSPAYPGEKGPGSCGYGCNEDMLNPNIFSTISYVPPFAQYSGFLQPGQANNSLDGYEPGFYTMAEDFASSFNSTGFLRKDALLAVVLVGTGNDTSYVNFCTNGNEEFPCDQVLAKQCTSITQSQPDGQVYSASQQANGCASGNVSLNYFVSQMQSLKNSAEQVKFFDATAAYNSATSGGLLCAGGRATPGTRYQQMAQALGGKSYDVCSQPLSSILSDVAQNLTSTALDYVQGYIVLSTATQENSAPDVSSIVVTKYVGGDPNHAVTVPQNPNNGWEYYGDVSNVPTIISPVPQNYESGYMLQLNGSAQLSGADYATVTYKMANGQSGH